MTYFKRQLLALTTVLWLLPGAVFASLPIDSSLGLQQHELRSIQRGDIVTLLRNTHESTLKDVLSVALIDAHPDEVWNVLTDYEKYGKMFPGILKGESRNKQGDTEDHYSLFDYPWPFEDRWTVNRLVHASDRRSIRWRRIEGTVKEIVGSWQLVPHGDQTLAIYSVRLDPGIPMIPKWAIDWGSRQVAPNIIKGVRQQVRENRRATTKAH